MVGRFRNLRVYRGASLPHGVSTSIRRTGERGAVCADSLDPTPLRAVNANIAEAWRKRLYPKYFVSKLSDADAEAAETRSWLDFALDHGYIAEDFYDEVDDRYD